MDWYQNLYIGETAKKNHQKILRKVNARKALMDVYLIIIPMDERNQLEILAPAEYYRQSSRKGDSMIVGIAGSKGEAFRLVRQMTEDVYRETGHAQLRQFFVS